MTGMCTPSCFKHALGARYCDRWVAWGEAAHANQSGVDRDLYGPRHAREIAHRVLNAPGDRPTALVCASVSLAVEALRVARENSIAVPTALSLICLDDAIELMDTIPSIACVSYSLKAIARGATEKLTGMLRGERDDAIRGDMRITVVKIDERGTIAPPPSGP